MFYGEYQHFLDRKGRLIIPARFRDIFREHSIEKVFITRGLDKCLFVFPEDEWRVQEHRFRSRSFTRQDARRFQRTFFGGAMEAVSDKQGRILLPRYLKEWAEIKTEIVVVGVSNRFEIWAKEVWEKFYEESRSAFEQVAERLVEGEEK